jgi:hypothetical protein
VSRYLVICRWCGVIFPSERRTRTTCTDACRQNLSRCKTLADDWQDRQWGIYFKASWQLPLLKWLGFVRDVSPEVQQQQAEFRARNEMRSTMTHSEKCKLGWQERRKWLKEWGQKWSEYMRANACPSCHLAIPHHLPSCEHYT